MDEFILNACSLAGRELGLQRKVEAEDDEIETTDEQQESTIFRPDTFDEYIGQENAKKILKQYIKAIKDRGKTFPHVLIHGKAGMGKTTLVRIIANMLDVGINELITSSIVEFSDLIKEIRETKEGILFLDEIHALERDLAEKIYTIMEEFKYKNKYIKPFTLVGATTELGELLKNRRPFYDRFKIIIELEDYNITDIMGITKQYKKMLFESEDIKSSVYKEIAMNSRGTPRTSLRLLEASVYYNGNIKEVLKNCNIIKDGFTSKDLKILKYIASNTAGVGLQGLASYLETSIENYLYLVEPYLLTSHAIMRTPRGRKITDAGINLIKDLSGCL